MQNDDKDKFIKKYNFQDGDGISKKEITKSKKRVKSEKLEKDIYLQLKKIFKNYSKHFPPLFLIDRRDKKDNIKFELGERNKKTNHRRKSNRRKNYFDRRHPQSFDDKFSLTENDRRREFSDRRDWIDFERRKIDKRRIIQSIKRISEIITAYKDLQTAKKSNDKNDTLPDVDEILLLIKNHLEEGYDSKSSDQIYDLLVELKLYISGEYRFCGKVNDDSLGFYYQWIDGRKSYFVKALSENEFPSGLKTTPSYKMDHLQCCIDFDPFNLDNKCSAGFCTQYTPDIKKGLQKTKLLKTVKNIFKKSR